MKVRKCTKCEERRLCAMAGPGGAWVCAVCLWHAALDLYEQEQAANKEEAS